MLRGVGSSAPQLGVPTTMPAADGMPERMLGRRAGRYVLRDIIASGGSGFVYLATDVALQRTVALKLIVPPASVDTQLAREFLLVEAQAVARIDHPHVVKVHDIGELDDMVFLAMEFVEGQNLRQWQRRARRGWREVLDVYAQARSGLAAAHAAGVVHRDVKPANIMLGDDGRVRVLDFGLAVPAVEPGANQVTSKGGPEDVDDVDSHPEGTPAYMAPEQLRGRVVDARSDQFSFCVALYEALYGRLPFPGAGTPEYVECRARGEIQPPTTASRVPAWLFPIVARGLAPDPAARHADLDALGKAIVEHRRRAQRRLLAVAATLWLAVVGSMSWHTHSAQAKLCDAWVARADDAWNDTRSAEIDSAFAATGLTYARATARDTIDALADQRGAWQQATRRACSHAWSQANDDPQAHPVLRCLDANRDQLAALAEHLAAASVSASTVRHADALVASLVDPSRCETATNAETHAMTAAASGADDWRALAAEPFAPDSSARDNKRSPASPGASHLRAGIAAERTGDLATALSAYHQATLAAERADDRRLAARAWLGQLRIHATFDLQPTWGREANDHVTALLDEHDTPELVVERLHHASALALRDADWSTARELASHGLARARTLRIDRSLMLALHRDLARADAEQGDAARAVSSLEAILQPLEATYRDHPDAIALLQDLAEFSHDQTRAHRWHQRALALATPRSGATAIEITTAHQRYAAWLSDHGDIDAALAVVAKLPTDTAAPNRPLGLDAARTLILLADLAVGRHDPATALDRLDRATIVVEAQFGADTLVGAHIGLRRSAALLANGDTQLARRIHADNLAALTRHLGPEHPQVVAARAWVNP